VSTCRNDTIGKTQYALLCHFGAYCVISGFPYIGIQFSQKHPLATNTTLAHSSSNSHLSFHSQSFSTAIARDNKAHSRQQQ
jgi:hypothetical protein